MRQIVSKYKEDKDRNDSVLVLLASYCFMIIINAPLVIYLTNSNQLWFDLKILIPIVLCLFFIGYTCSVFVVLIIKRIISVKSFDIFFSIIVFLYWAMYIQGNFIPRNYGDLDGHVIQWSSYLGYAIASIAVWGASFIVAITIALKHRNLLYKVARYTGCIITVMLVVALVSLFPQADKFVNNEFETLTRDGEFSVSSGKNIIVLCLDMFDGEFLDNLLNEDTEKYSDILQDFTFYDNTVGLYSRTYESIPYILTGSKYLYDTGIMDYRRNVYPDSKLFNLLDENNYDINIYTEEWLPVEKLNIKNKSMGKHIIGSYPFFIKTMYKVVLFNYMPHQLKRYFVVYSGLFNGSMMLTTDDADGKNAACVFKVPVYLKTIDEEGLKCDSNDKNSFRFIHLEGTHPPYYINANGVDDGVEHSLDEAVCGNMELVKRWIESLKEAGVYDNTAILILADHGHSDEYEPLERINPLLLVKGFDEHHEFEISKNSVSYVDIIPTIDAWVTGVDNEDAIWNQTDENRVRIYYESRWVNGGAVRFAEEYEIIGNIKGNQWKATPTGKTYGDEKQPL